MNEYSTQDEKIARRVCELLGVDPEYAQGYDGHNQSTYGLPRWKLEAAQIRERRAWFIALTEASANPPEAKP